MVPKFSGYPRGKVIRCHPMATSQNMRACLIETEPKAHAADLLNFTMNSTFSGPFGSETG